MLVKNLVVLFPSQAIDKSTIEVYKKGSHVFQQSKSSPIIKKYSNATTLNVLFLPPLPLFSAGYFFLSLDANFSSFSLVKSPPSELQITGYK